MSHVLYPVSRIRRSRVFEDLFDRYLAEGEEGPFDLLLPPHDWPSTAVESVPRLPYEVRCVVMSFVRPRRLEVLAVHLLCVVLDAARQEEEYWLQRQKQYLQRTLAMG